MMLLSISLVRSMPADPCDKPKHQATLACLEEGSQLREIAPKASFDLLAGSWHGAPESLRNSPIHCSSLPS